jgi:uncharacterized protein (TIGR00369 family)
VARLNAAHGGAFCSKLAAPAEFSAPARGSVAGQHEMSLLTACSAGCSGYTAAVPFDEPVLAKFIASMSPHMCRLRLEVLSIQGGVCVAQLPYSEELVGDPASGVLHGGVVTSLLDTVGGAAVISAVGEPLPLATLDLRIDYLRPSTPGQTVRAKVECYKKTYNIAFARGVAFESDESDPIASMAATYMLRTQIRRAEGA